MSFLIEFSFLHFYQNANLFKLHINLNISIFVKNPIIFLTSHLGHELRHNIKIIAFLKYANDINVNKNLLKKQDIIKYIKIQGELL